MTIGFGRKTAALEAGAEIERVEELVARVQPRRARVRVGAGARGEADQRATVGERDRKHRSDLQHRQREHAPVANAGRYARRRGHVGRRDAGEQRVAARDATARAAHATAAGRAACTCADAACTAAARDATARAARSTRAAFAACDRASEARSGSAARPGAGARAAACRGALHATCPGGALAPGVRATRAQRHCDDRYRPAQTLHSNLRTPHPGSTTASRVATPICASSCRGALERLSRQARFCRQGFSKRFARARSVRVPARSGRRARRRSGTRPRACAQGEALRRRAPATRARRRAARMH